MNFMKFVSDIIILNKTRKACWPTEIALRGTPVEKHCCIRYFVKEFL